MVGLDTNVLARYIVQDDPSQSAAATRLIEEHCTVEVPGYVSVTVLVELVWVLTRAYGYEKPVVIEVIRQVLRTAELVVEDHHIIWAALREFAPGTADFADYLIAHRNHARGCARTCTFDRRAARGRYFALVT
ncbi:MAG: type II toxin-antitoxin system VapC family toxin [Acidobacteria bacterium]|nr:type II toxin-antitoxin system VapC family toxin [Acidobacteriota bacterium]MYJ05065.1 type II toxin-antitoxin system VapC family toxin [Acidobacteriota bacterium]